jgi:hypothetical protein
LFHCGIIRCVCARVFGSLAPRSVEYVRVHSFARSLRESCLAKNYLRSEELSSLQRFTPRKSHQNYRRSEVTPSASFSSPQISLIEKLSSLRGVFKLSGIPSQKLEQNEERGGIRGALPPDRNVQTQANIVSPRLRAKTTGLPVFLSAQSKKILVIGCKLKEK